VLETKNIIVSPSDPNCTTSFLELNKNNYNKALADSIIINSYITLNNCESNEGKIDVEIAACQRKLTLRNEKKVMIESYELCGTEMQ
jgi:hypothetical protein